MAAPRNQEALDKALKQFEECRKDHDIFIEKVEERYKVYRGVLDEVSDAAQWTSKAHPPYIMHIVETTLASFVDDHLRFRIKPVPSLDFLLDPSFAERAARGAKAHEALFNWQVQRDKLTQTQRPFLLQNSIAGLSVLKTYWTNQQERRRVMVPREEPLLDANDVPIIGMNGQPVTTVVMEEKTRTQVVYDGPTTEVVDIRDFLWPSNAVDLKSAAYVVHRVWKHPEEIEREFREGGQFGPSRGGWSLREVGDKLSDSRDFTEDRNSREQQLWDIERTKGLVEVLEVWDRLAGTVTWIANRCALLAHIEKFPFHHERYPFTVCSTQPDLFRLPGISQVEKIAHLQTMLWDIQNQSLDALRLAANPIFWFRPDVEDPEAYEFFPGARWLVESPDQIASWAADPRPAEITMPREALLKGDMQNLAGGMPFSSGTDSQFVDQKTATGASLVTNIAQRGMDMQKQQANAAYEDVGQQRVILNQQFTTTPTVAPITGLDGKEITAVILPEILYGDYEFGIEPIPNAMMEQQEQASAMGLLQVILGAFGPISAAAQMGAATPINLDAYVEDLLRAHGKTDLNRYFRSKAPVGVPGPAGGGAVGAPGASPLSPDPVGVTGPQSIDPAVSPSSGISLSPVAAQQRAQALDRS